MKTFSKTNIKRNWFGMFLMSVVVVPTIVGELVLVGSHLVSCFGLL